MSTSIFFLTSKISVLFLVQMKFYQVHKPHLFKCAFTEYGVLLSTHALPIGLPFVYPPSEVSHRSGTMQYQIPTSSIFVEYTIYMRGVDIADQLRS